MTRRLFLLLVSPTLLSDNVLAQDYVPRALSGCSKISCEEDVIRGVALDSLLTALRSRWPDLSEPPRVLATVYMSPFFVRSGRPAVDVLDAPEWYSLRRRYRDLVVVDSLHRAFDRDGVLTAGGPLFVVAPITWRGDSAAVLRVGVFPAPRHHAHEAWVRLHFRDGSWRIVLIETGWIE